MRLATECPGVLAVKWALCDQLPASRLYTPSQILFLAMPLPRRQVFCASATQTLGPGKPRVDTETRIYCNCYRLARVFMLVIMCSYFCIHIRIRKPLHSYLYLYIYIYIDKYMCKSMPHVSHKGMNIYIYIKLDVYIYIRICEKEHAHMSGRAQMNT